MALKTEIVALFYRQGIACLEIAQGQDNEWVSSEARFVGNKHNRMYHRYGWE